MLMIMLLFLFYSENLPLKFGQNRVSKSWNVVVAVVKAVHFDFFCVILYFLEHGKKYSFFKSKFYLWVGTPTCGVFSRSHCGSHPLMNSKFSFFNLNFITGLEPQLVVPILWFFTGCCKLRLPTLEKSHFKNRNNLNVHKKKFMHKKI